MEIKGNVHCFFEQSGTFKNEFKKLGYNAFDYDIQNNFGETDYCEDLFSQIENAYSWWASIFDKMTNDDLIIAFFPCIYFENIKQMYFSLDSLNIAHLPLNEKISKAIEQLEYRTKYHTLLYKFVSVCYKKKLRLIIENPTTGPTYLIHGQNFPKPTYIDKDRTRRGDFFVKSTGYWYFNCEQTYGLTLNQTPKNKIKIVYNCKKAPKAGLCSEERSLISPTYARNFICDKIIGKETDESNKQLTIHFEEYEKQL